MTSGIWLLQLCYKPSRLVACEDQESLHQEQREKAELIKPRTKEGSPPGFEHFLHLRVLYVRLFNYYARMTTPVIHGLPVKD